MGPCAGPGAFRRWILLFAGRGILLERAANGGHLSEKTTRTILVTGASGFVGSAVLRRLVNEGYAVRALVRPTSDRRNLDGVAVEVALGPPRAP